MAQRPDLRQISGNIQEALADYDRDALLAILTYVFKEYVVEGPPPMLVNQAERLEDLEGFSFAQIIRALQTRFDHPELSLFQVEGETVNVRIQGVLHALAGAAASGRRGPASPSPSLSLSSSSSQDAARPAAAPAAPPIPGVRVVETTLTRRPRSAGERVSVTDAAARGRSDIAGGAAPAEAPRARNGLSVGGRSTARGGAMMSPSEQSETGNAPADSPTASGDGNNQPAAATPSDSPAKDGGDDDASIRFSLLEFD